MGGTAAGQGVVRGWIPLCSSPGPWRVCGERGSGAILGEFKRELLEGSLGAGLGVVWLCWELNP